MNEFDYDSYLNLANIHTGKVVDVSSDLFSVAVYCMKYKLEFNPDHLIDSLKNMVGRDGTLLIRAFSWEFCKGIPFHINSTRSAVGSLGIVAMNRLEFKRTKHPLYSWFVYGKYAEQLCEIHAKEAFGSDSVFAFLEDMNALQIGIGKQKSSALTMCHYAEAKANAQYRHHKIFRGEYYDENEVMTISEYSMFVRPLNIEVINIFGKDITQGIFLEQGIRENYLYNQELPLCKFDLRRATKFVCNDLEINDGKHTMMVNNVPGIIGCGIDWSKAQY